MLFKKRHPPIGARPGTLVGDASSPTPVIRVFSYDVDTVKDTNVEEPAALREFLSSEKTVWIDVQGLGDLDVVRSIAEIFHIHPLAMEDVVNAPQRPKAEAYDDHYLFITRMVHAPSDITSLTREQVSVFVGANYVLTFQERYGDIFEPIRQRLRDGKGPMRRSGPGYLAYALLDLVIDAYFPILEMLGEHLEELEDEVVNRPSRASLHKLYEVKRELLTLRRAVWPNRELLSGIMRSEDEFFSEQVREYLRDVYDHCAQLADVLETYREMAGGLLDLYLSSVANRTNDVMKVLTIMASVFIPLTFIAGVYGMNFQTMPELGWRYGYPVALAAMLLVGMGMVYAFARMGWIGRDRDDEGSSGA